MKKIKSIENRNVYWMINEKKVKNVNKIYKWV